MKKMLLTLLFCIGGAVCAEANLYFDVPRGMSKTWNITNYETGLAFDLYESRDENMEGEFLIIAGQTPICECVGTELEAILPFVMGTLQEACPVGKIENELGLAVSVEAIPLYSEDDSVVRRVQFYFDPNEVDGSAIIDAHLVIKDGILYLIAVGASGEAHLDAFDNLTEFVLYSMTTTR